MRLLILGPPGSGKGTQAVRLSEQLGVRHISSGELLRSEVSRGTDCGRAVQEAIRAGDLVPDEFVIDMLREPILEASAAGGYLLDGFPRTLAQAEKAAEMAREEGVTADAAIYLRCDDEVLLKRLLGRSARAGRSDDNEATIRHRLEVFHAKTEPLVRYYDERGILIEVDGDQPMDDVTQEIRARLPATS